MLFWGKSHTFTLLACIAILLTGCLQNRNKVVVKGKIAEAGSQRIILCHMSSTAMEPVDSTLADKKGRFRLKSSLAQPEFFALQLKGKKDLIILAAHPGEQIMLLSENKNFCKNYTIKGSVDSEKVLELVQNQDNMQEQVKKLGQMYFDSINSSNLPRLKLRLDSAYDALVKETKDFTRQFIRENNMYLASLMALYQQLPSSNPMKQEPVVTMDDDYACYHLVDSVLNTLYPASLPVKLLRSQMISWDQHCRQLAGVEKRVGTGAIAPDITLPSSTGDTLSLKNFRGKYVWLVFWASWDQKSRSANIVLRTLYQHYHWKGLEIFQVSLDQNRDAWIQAIRNDQLSWPQVSDLKFWNSVVVPIYQIQSLPLCLLLDPNGRITARDVAVDKLLATTEKLFSVKPVVKDTAKLTQ